MNILTRLRRIVEEPLPEFAFELSPAGIAYARHGKTLHLGFEPLEPDVLVVSPLHDNVARPEALFERVRALAPPNGRPRRRTAALILPDYCTRVAVLDFDAFPSDPQEQLSLVRFRIKKGIPFELESARVSYQVQSGGTGGKKYQVVVAVAALEIVARYEAGFRAVGFEPGYVTTSSLAALHLLGKDGGRVLAKLSGEALAVSVVEGESLRLVRCVELPEVSVREVMAVLYPTFAYIEDELARRPENLLLCGFGAMSESVASQIESEFGIRVQPLRSRLGQPDHANAGLLGYLEAMGETAA
jgi:type IV pilus assembly protein PilM